MEIQLMLLCGDGAAMKAFSVVSSHKQLLGGGCEVPWVDVVWTKFSQPKVKVSIWMVLSDIN